MRTPDDVVAEIRQTRGELLRGSSAIYDAEVKADIAALVAQKTEDLAFINAEGSVEFKKAAARIASEEESAAAAIARAEFNRIKVKIRGLESALVSLQAELKWMKEEGA